MYSKRCLLSKIWNQKMDSFDYLLSKICI